MSPPSKGKTHPATRSQPPAVSPPSPSPERVPHTWPNFLEWFRGFLLHLVSGHNTLVKGVCGRIHSP